VLDFTSIYFYYCIINWKIVKEKKQSNETNGVNHSDHIFDGLNREI